MIRAVVSTGNTSSKTSSACGLDDTWTSFLLWDIEREFQTAHEAYEQWMRKTQRRRSTWDILAGSRKEDPLHRSLRLGSQVQKAVQEGQRKFGQKFDKGDATCHTVLAAQLLRLQREVCVPLLDTIQSRYLCPIPHYEVLRAARGVRRTCLDALQQQTVRLSTRKIEPYLPPPRFSVKFCPLALQLQKDQTIGHSSKLHTQKVKPQDPYDDREQCPYCKAVVSIAAHSGLPRYRCILFESHTLSPHQNQKNGERASFSCSSCYKTFDDSYAFLEHVFQKETGSEQSCLKRHNFQFSVDTRGRQSNARLVEQCLKNCLEREMTRSLEIDKGREMLKV